MDLQLHNFNKEKFVIPNNKDESNIISNTMMYYLICYLLKKDTTAVQEVPKIGLRRIIKKLETKPNVYSFTKEYDLMIIITMGFFDLVGQLKRLIRSRFQFKCNHIAIYIRALKLYSLYPLLIILDFFILKELNRKRNMINLTYIFIYIQSMNTMKTPVSFFMKQSFKEWNIQKILDIQYESHLPLNEMFKQIEKI